MTSPPTAAIAITGLRKSYGDKVVLDGIDLDVAEGTIFSLLGPNGAGKTTMVHILSTLIAADGGRRARRWSRRGPRSRRRARRDRRDRSVLGGRRAAHRRGEPGPDGRPAPPGPGEGRRRAAELLERFDLVDAAGKPAGTYSGGMKRRLDLAMTLVGDPRIIFLDEPTAGLDPRSRHTMWQIIRELVADGVTIFLTTQYLDEADELADRIAVLDHGRLIAEGTRGAQAPRPRRPHPAAVRRSGELEAAARARGRRPRRRRAHPPGPERRRRAVAAGPAPPARRAVARGRSSRSTRRTSTMSSSPSRANPTRKGQPCHEHPRLYGERFGTMLRRNLRHMRRYPSLTVMLVGMPVVFLLLFVYVFGGTLGAGLGGPTGGRAEYLAYVIPGILLMAVAGVAQGTAISVAMDMTEGIIARFRTMAIFRPSVLTGHVVGAMIQTASASPSSSSSPCPSGSGPRPGPSSGSAAVGAPGHDRLRPHLAGGRLRPGQQERRDRQQPAHAADAAALPQQRVRPHRVDAGRPALVRRAPALHALHRDPAGPADGHAIGNSAVVAVAWCVSSPSSATCGPARPSTAIPGPRQLDRPSLPVRWTGGWGLEWLYAAASRPPALEGNRRGVHLLEYECCRSQRMAIAPQIGGR